MQDGRVAWPNGWLISCLWLESYAYLYDGVYRRILAPPRTFKNIATGARFPSQSFYLDTIEQTYNKDPSLALYQKNQT